MQKYCFTLYSLLFCLASTTSLLKTIYPQPLWASFGWRRRVASVGGAMLTLHTGWKNKKLVWYLIWYIICKIWIVCEPCVKSCKIFQMYRSRFDILEICFHISSKLSFLLWYKITATEKTWKFLFEISYTVLFLIDMGISKIKE